MSNFWQAIQYTLAGIRERVTNALGGVSLASFGLGSPQYSNPWPPPQDRPRLASYQRFRQIYEGEHEEVFVRHGKYKYDEQREYLTVNLCGEITNLLTDRLAGEAINIYAPGEDDPTQEFIDHLGAECDFEQFWVNWLTDTSPRGDGVLKVRYDAETEEVLIEQAPPSTYFVDGEEQMIAWMIWHDSKPYLRQEIHFPGRIENRLFELHGSLLDGKMGFDAVKDRRELSLIPELQGLPDEQPTGVDDILLVHVALGGGNRIWGRSDYTDIDGLQGELNNRETQRSEVLDKHAYPRMAGPRLYIDEGGNVATLDDYIQVDSESQIPQYVTWDAQLGPTENEIRELKRDICLVAGISPASLQETEGGGPESGRALRLREHRTASAVRRRQKEYGPAIRRAVSLATKLHNSKEIGDTWTPDVGDVTPLEPEDVRQALEYAAWLAQEELHIG